MWGLKPDIFPVLRKKFDEFLATSDITKDEFQIPKVIDSVIKSGLHRVRVYHTDSVWYGMTYHEDKKQVADAIKKMTDEGIYPEELWK